MHRGKNTHTHNVILFCLSNPEGAWYLFGCLKMMQFAYAVRPSVCPSVRLSVRPKTISSETTERISTKLGMQYVHDPGTVLGPNNFTIFQSLNFGNLFNF